MPRILIVEDEVSLARAMGDALSAEGHEVRLVHVGEKVMPEFRSFEPQICLLDVRLGGVSGLDVLAEIKSESPDTDRGERGLSAETLDAHTPRPEEMLTAQELSGALREAIEQLPDKLRTPLLLFCVDKLPQKEIADIMQVSLATVKWSVFEARRRLRKQLGSMLD